MIHEHEATQLASAAIDFPLTPDEEHELRHELAGCPVCAERAASYHEQARMLARLPIVTASDETRRRVTAAAMSGRTTTRSPLVLALAAALLVGLLLALTAAAGALLDGPNELAVIPTTPPRASDPALASQAPSPSAAVGLGGNGSGPIFADPLAVDSIAEVVSGNLRVRSEPRVATSSIMYEPLLQVGNRLFIAEGPVVADGYDWYRVVPFGTDMPTGWVARGDHDATPWIAPANAECPSQPVEIASLNAMHPLARLACFGNEPLAFRAVIDGGPDGGWIADSRLNGYLEAEGPGQALELVPSAGLEPDDLPDGRAAALVGALDDPRCADLVDGGLDCRTKFLVSDVSLDAVALNAGDLAMTITDDLRVRDRPVVEDTGRRELLPTGTQLAIVGGPAVASGYTWYRVVVPAVGTTDGGRRVGWVAAQGKDGEAWIGEDEFDCPAPAALTFETFAVLTSPAVFHGGLACYGRDGPFPGASVAVEGRVRLDCTGPPVTGSIWLMDHQRSLVLVDDGVEARAAMASYADPLSCDGPASPIIYRATGHFDDDDAPLCRRPEADPDLPDEVAVYECRSRFVVTELSAIGNVPTPLPPP